MPRRELKNGKQVADWSAELGAKLNAPGTITIIGSADLLPPRASQMARWRSRQNRKSFLNGPLTEGVGEFGASGQTA